MLWDFTYYSLGDLIVNSFLSVLESHLEPFFLFDLPQGSIGEMFKAFEVLFDIQRLIQVVFLLLRQDWSVHGGFISVLGSKNGRIAGEFWDLTIIGDLRNGIFASLTHEPQPVTLLFFQLINVFFQ